MSPPRAIHYPKPAYTTEALEKGIAGVVTFLVEFDIEGNFKILRMEKGLGFGLDENALDSLLHWRFDPAFRSGKESALSPAWMSRLASRIRPKPLLEDRS